MKLSHVKWLYSVAFVALALSIITPIWGQTMTVSYYDGMGVLGGTSVLEASPIGTSTVFDGGRSFIPFYSEDLDVLLPKVLYLCITVIVLVVLAFWINTLERHDQRENRSILRNSAFVSILLLVFNLCLFVLLWLQMMTEHGYFAGGRAMIWGTTTINASTFVFWPGMGFFLQILAIIILFAGLMYGMIIGKRETAEEPRPMRGMG